jgi:hypothetical protein
MKAELEGDSLRVLADGVAVWEGTLPAEALRFDGPVGVRTDNSDFAFELRAPVSVSPKAACAGEDLAK